MRTYEMRVYTLRTKQALDYYASTVYPRHLTNFGLFGVEAHGYRPAAHDHHGSCSFVCRGGISG